MMSNLLRAMQIIECLADEPRGLRITDLAERLAVNRAIPHRILSDLRAGGYVVQDPDTERYRATFKLGSVGLRQLESAGTFQWAQDELSRLAQLSRELVRVSILSEQRLRFVAQAQGANATLMIVSPLRAELPLHATASGKAYLSTLTDNEVTALIGEQGLASFTRSTVTVPDALLAELAQARSDGFALVEEEIEVGINAIAAPITAAMDGRVVGVGAVSIAGPSARLSRQRLLELAPALLDTTQRLSEQWHVYRYLSSLAAGPSSGEGQGSPQEVLTT